MKKIFCSVLCLFLLLSGGCANIGKKGTEICNLYFLNTEGTAMITETRTVPDNNTDVLKFAVEELLKGPVEMENKRAIPEGTKLISVSVKDGVATVDLNGKFDEGTDVQRLWSRYTLICTVCSVDGIKKVRMLSDGNRLVGLSTGEPLDALGKEDIVTDNSQVHNDKTTLTLYFADSNAMYLVAETRQVEISEGEKTEKAVVEELVKGPVNENLFRLLRPEVKVISTETKNGVCFVNFSKEFSAKDNGGSAEELLMVYSVVNSLCELENVDKVQFLVEGKKIESLSHMDMSEPFGMNADILNSGSTAN